MNFQGANILVDADGCIKLADFGLSKQVVELAHRFHFLHCFFHLYIQCLLCVVTSTMHITSKYLTERCIIVGCTTTLDGS